MQRWFSSLKCFWISTFPALYNALGVFAADYRELCDLGAHPVYGRAARYNFSESVVYGLGAGVGWALAITALAGVREELKYSDVPDGLKGLGITFITVGLMSV